MLKNELISKIEELEELNNGLNNDLDYYIKESNDFENELEKERNKKGVLHEYEKSLKNLSLNQQIKLTDFLNSLIN